MGIDQQGEQCIKIFKGQGGQSGDTHNEHVFLRNNICSGTINDMLDTGLHLLNHCKNSEKKSQ